MYEFVLVANLLLWLGITANFARQPAASVFHPVSYYLFFHGFVFTVRPIIAHLLGFDAIYRIYEFTPSAEDKITVILASMLGLVCFVGVASRFGQTAFRFVEDRFLDAERRQLVRPLLIVSALLAPIALFSIVTGWLTRSSETSTMVLDAATGHTLNTTGIGYFDEFQLVLAPLVVLTIWLFRFRWWTLAMLAGFVILRSGTGGRWPILMTCATVALLFLYERRKTLPNLRAIGLVLVALWLFQVVGVDRGATVRSAFVEENSIALSQGQGRELGLLESMDFANLEYFEFIVFAVPQRTGTYGYFLDNLQIFTEPIPRRLWADKPAGAPIKLFSLFDHGYPIGMTFSLPGEGWMQLGYLGVAIWCGLFGWLFGWIYQRYQSSAQSTLATVAFMLFLPLSLQFFRDGLLLTLVKTSTWFLVPILLIHVVARLSAVPLASDFRLLAKRKLARRQPDIAPKLLARQRAAKRRAAGRPTR